MKNKLLFILKSKLILNVKGHNIERFIKRMSFNKIEILSIKYLSKEEINIEIYKKDYEKLLSLKTIYEVNIIGLLGINSINNKAKTNKYIIIFILIGLVFLYCLSSMIFEIKIVSNDKLMIESITKELKKMGVSKYKFKKNYNQLQKIKKELINKYRDKIEWIEIENIGTKYIIKYEPRIIINLKKETGFRNIIASKDSIIYSMDITNGQIVKNVKTYVKKGDVIVSGYISMNNNIKDTIRANGTVYGETWYTVTITYPYKYYEKIETGKKKNALVLKILNRNIEILNFNKYKEKSIVNYTLIRNNLLPFKFVLQKQKELKIIKENNTEKELIEKAIKYSSNKLKDKLKTGEFIKEYKVLNKTKNSDSLTLNIFYNIVENITDYQEIDEYIPDT